MLVERATLERPAPDALVRGVAALGDLELTLCTDGSFVLDGGAMFGVVPKTLWSRTLPADPDNYVQLGTNTVVVRTGTAVVIIETGIGNKQSAKLLAIHRNQQLLPASLAAAGVRVEEVTHVINTHLHFDHCGWNTTLDANGTLRPTFPNARYFAAAGELAHGRLQLDRDRISYRSANYDPLIATGQLTLIDPHGAGEFTPNDARLASPGLPSVRIETGLELLPGIALEALPGHTPHMLGVHLMSRAHGGAAEHACYPGDLLPTAHHLAPTWVMGYDLDPLRCIEERKRLLHRVIAEDWLVLFTHDHDLPAARLAWNEQGRPVVR